MLHEGSIENFTSPRLKERLRSKLSSDKIHSFLRDKFTDESTLWRPLIAYEIYSSRSKVVNPDVLVEASPDPEDNELLSVAVCSGADVVITLDRRHLLSLRDPKTKEILIEDEQGCRVFRVKSVNSCRVHRRSTETVALAHTIILA